MTKVFGVTFQAPRIDWIVVATLAIATVFSAVICVAGINATSASAIGALSGGIVSGMLGVNSLKSVPNFLAAGRSGS